MVDLCNDLIQKIPPNLVIYMSVLCYAMINSRRISEEAAGLTNCWWSVSFSVVTRSNIVE